VAVAAADRVVDRAMAGLVLEPEQAQVQGQGPREEQAPVQGQDQARVREPALVRVTDLVMGHASDQVERVIMRVHYDCEPTY
jgi:hypothetical protein